MNLDFYTAPHIVLGCGCIQKIGDVACGHGTKALLLHGTAMEEGLLRQVCSALKLSHIDVVVHCKPSGEPSPEMVDQAVLDARRAGCDFVIAIGGGSVIDTGKAVCGLTPNEGGLEEYLEGVGNGRKMVCSPLPLIAVPTTHGTGAEATCNAVISSAAAGYKKSFRDKRLMAKEVLIDAELMTSLPKKSTADCNMDALTQLIEAYVSVKANALTDALCISGLEAAAEGIVESFENGDSLKAREKMAYAALMSGIALSNGGLGAVHGIAPALGISYGIGHGESCGLLLDHVMEWNLKFNLERYAAVGCILTGGTFQTPYQAAVAGVQYVKELKQCFGIAPDLQFLQIAPEELDSIASKVSSNSMSGNPVPMDKDDVKQLLSKLI